MYYEAPTRTHRNGNAMTPAHQHDKVLKKQQVNTAENVSVKCHCAVCPCVGHNTIRDTLPPLNCWCFLDYLSIRENTQEMAYPSCFPVLYYFHSQNLQTKQSINMSKFGLFGLFVIERLPIARETFSLGRLFPARIMRSREFN